MKLITKFILIYLLVTLIVLGIGGFISYFIIKDEIDNELKWDFLERIDRVTYLMERGRDFGRRGKRGDISRDENLTIEILDQITEDHVEVTDTLIWHDRLEQYERNLKVSAYRTINDQSYYISTYGTMIESDDITEAVSKILLWILGMQILGAIGIGFFVSGRLFKPFRVTLNKIKHFKLHERKHIPAEQTGVKEFNDLNKFVEEMTRKVVSDFRNLKEFSENASHELQTPLAIAKGNLELLAETPLTSDQYTYIETLEKSIKKCSHLSESLALLTKIENHEYNNDQRVNLSKLIKEGIETFREFIELNNLSLETNIEDDVVVDLHPALADIVLSNLLQNSIKHNVENGKIRIELTDQKWTIANTGKKLSVEPSQLFDRFRKGDQNSESIGLGLSIVKRIADQYLNGVDYRTEQKWHILSICLKDVKQA